MLSSCNLFLANPHSSVNFHFPIYDLRLRILLHCCKLFFKGNGWGLKWLATFYLAQKVLRRVREGLKIMGQTCPIGLFWEIIWASSLDLSLCLISQNKKKFSSNFTGHFGWNHTSVTQHRNEQLQNVFFFFKSY